MSTMRNLEKKFDAISLREQRLIFYALPLVLCFVFVLGLIEPAIADAMKAKVDIQNARLKLTTVSQSLEAVELQLQVDPDDETREQISVVNDQIEKVEQRFERELTKLIDPSIMPLVLEQILRKSGTLTLVEMESIPPKNIFAKDNAVALNQNPDMADAEKASLPVLFEHGLRVVFEGSFAETQRFLVEAEELNWKLYWDSVKLTTKEYPSSRVEIKLFSLSTSEAYLNVR